MARISKFCLSITLNHRSFGFIDLSSKIPTVQSVWVIPKTPQQRYPTLSIRLHSSLAWIAILGGWLLFGIAAIIALYFALAAQKFFEDRAILKLEPTYVGRFAAANARHIWSAQHRVIIFGDSRVAWWNPVPSSANTQFVLRGVPGETIFQMRYRFANDVLALKPDTVAIQAGINDLIAAAAVAKAKPHIQEEAFSTLQSFVEQSRIAGIRVIVFTVVRPSTIPIWRLPFWPDSVLTDVQRFNADIRRLKGDGISVLDADKLLTDGGSTVVSSYSYDTLHFTALAYRKLNSELTTILGDQ